MVQGGFGGVYCMCNHTLTPTFNLTADTGTEEPFCTAENVSRKKQIYSPAKTIITYLHDGKRVITESPRLWVGSAHIPAEMRAAAGWGRDERTKEKRNDLEEVR